MIVRNQERQHLFVPEPVEKRAPNLNCCQCQPFQPRFCRTKTISHLNYKTTPSSCRASSFLGLPNCFEAAPVFLFTCPLRGQCSAAAAVVALAATVVAAAVVPAATAVVADRHTAPIVAEQEQQDDDPPAVVATAKETRVAVHKEYLRNLMWSGFVSRSFHGIQSSGFCANRSAIVPKV